MGNRLPGEGSLVNTPNRQDAKRYREDVENEIIEPVSELFKECLETTILELQNVVKKNPEKKKGADLLISFLQEILKGKKAESVTLKIPETAVKIREQAIKFVYQRDFGTLDLSDGRTISIDNWPADFEDPNLYVLENGEKKAVDLKDILGLVVKASTETRYGRKVTYNNGVFSVDCSSIPSATFALSALEDLLTTQQYHQERQAEIVDLLPESEKCSMDLKMARRKKEQK